MKRCLGGEGFEVQFYPYPQNSWEQLNFYVTTGKGMKMDE